MKLRQILIAIVILGTVWHTAAAQPKKKNVQADAPPPETILAGTSMQPNPVLSDLIAIKPEMPLGPQILRNRHELSGRQDIGRFLCSRAGPTNKSNYP